MDRVPVLELLETLYPRLGFLDGVTLTGGEPLLHRGLVPFLRELKRIGYKVKIDTNASRVDTLKFLIQKHLIDYVSVQIVAPFRKYQEVTGFRVKPETMAEAVHVVRSSNIMHEFMFMPVPSIHNTADLLEVAHILAGSRKLVIQVFHPELSIDKSCRELEQYTLTELETIKEIMSPYFHEVVIKK
jgi:pyruvate formate lyase activating enzyme